MKNLLVIIFLMISFSMSYGQKERSHNRSGVKEYLEGDYTNAELDFMKALEYDSTSFAANYNTASTLYKLGKYEDANKMLANLGNSTESQEYLPDMLHNLGNNFMKQEIYDKAVEAYKNSLRLRPDDEETRYNLSYAQAKLKQQQQDKEDNKDKKDQDNKDKQDEKNKEDKQDKEEQEQEQQKQDQQQSQEEKKDQQQAQEKKELSKEDVERILQAIQQQEKDVKEKVDKEKAKVKKVKTEKDW